MVCKAKVFAFKSTFLLKKRVDFVCNFEPNQISHYKLGGSILISGHWRCVCHQEKQTRPIHSLKLRVVVFAPGVVFVPKIKAFWSLL
jgi:1,4-alpha-glucan branching enzyme